MTAPTGFEAWWAERLKHHEFQIGQRSLAEAAWTAALERVRPWLQHRKDCRKEVCLIQGRCAEECSCDCGLDAATERSAG